MSLRKVTIPKKYRAGLADDRGIDWRAREPREYLGIFRAYLDEQLAGEENASPIERELVGHLAHSVLQTRKIGRVVFKSDGTIMSPKLLALWVQHVYLQIRIAGIIGTKRRSKRLPSLQEYLAAKSNESPVAASVASPTARAASPASRTSSPARDAATEGPDVQEADASE